MARKKLNTDEIDEEFLLSTINNDKPASEQNKEAAIPEKILLCLFSNQRARHAPGSWFQSDRNTTNGY